VHGKAEGARIKRHRTIINILFALTAVIILINGGECHSKEGIIQAIFRPARDIGIKGKEGLNVKKAV
jgi:hypothetical protein